MNPSVHRPFVLRVVNLAEHQRASSAHDALAEAMEFGAQLRERTADLGRRYTIESLDGERWELLREDGLFIWRKNDISIDPRRR